MNKYDLIYEYSDPYKVYKKSKFYFGNNVNIQLSNRKDKKYMIKNPYTDKWVHFGQMGYEDFTKHNDKNRRNNFLRRNKKFKYNDNIYSPSFMSYYLLW